MELAREAYHLLRRLGAEPVYEASIAGLLGGPSIDARLEHVEKAVVIGGDGTVLRFMQLVGLRESPLLHLIPLGRRTFLFEKMAPREALERLQDFLGDRYGVEELSRLRVETRGFTAAALNEAAVLALGSKTVGLRVAVGDDVAYRGLEGDGVIVASPAGSTAYSYSAGGPVLHPRLAAVTVTPVNPVDRSAGPLVAPGTEPVRILVERSMHPVKLIVDGVQERLLYRGAVVEARLGAPPARIARYRERPGRLRTPWSARCSC